MKKKFVSRVVFLLLCKKQMYANLKNVGKLLNSPTHQLGGLVHLNYQNTFSSGMFVSFIT